MGLRYINMHSHDRGLPPDDEIRILNLFPHEEIPYEGNPQLFYSIGLHPWYATRDGLDNELASIRRALVHGRILAIGEVGLDRLSETPMDVQEEVFRAQVEIAKTFRKPIILHCVKAYPELIRLHNEFCHWFDDLPWIVHGYENNLQIMEQLIDHDFYLSFGAGLLKRPKLVEVFAAIPKNRFFLETDDSDSSIGEIYGAAAGILGIDEQEVIKMVARNLEQCFHLHPKKTS